MALIDSHAHLTAPDLIDKREDVLARSRHAGVDKILTVATDIADASKAVEMASRHPSEVRVIAGFHPHEADSVEPGHIDEMIRKRSAGARARHFDQGHKHGHVRRLDRDPEVDQP